MQQWSKIRPVSNFGDYNVGTPVLIANQALAHAIEQFMTILAVLVTPP